MQITKSLQKQLVLNKLYDHLHRKYSFTQPRKRFLDTTPHDIDAVLAFKSDIELEEFQSALDRIEDGRFGSCLRCRKEIILDDLRRNPCKRYCGACEGILLKSNLGRTREDRRHLHGS